MWCLVNSDQQVYHGGFLWVGSIVVKQTFPYHKHRTGHYEFWWTSPPSSQAVNHGESHLASHSFPLSCFCLPVDWDPHSWYSSYKVLKRNARQLQPALCLPSFRHELRESCVARPMTADAFKSVNFCLLGFLDFIRIQPKEKEDVSYACTCHIWWPLQGLPSRLL